MINIRYSRRHRRHVQIITVALTSIAALGTMLAFSPAPTAAADTPARLISAVWTSPEELTITGTGIDTGEGQVQVRNGGEVIGSKLFFTFGPGGSFQGRVQTDQCNPKLHYTYLVFDGELTENGGYAVPLPTCTVTPLAQKWLQQGGPSGYLGYPIASVTLTPGLSGAYLPFQGREIYWSYSSGAHLIVGYIGDKYASLGWEQSLLGFPTSDEATSTIAAGQYQQFQNGTILWRPGTTQAYAVQGLIKAKWAKLGYEGGFLGYPITDERTTVGGAGRFNYFQGGAIYWTSATGAHEVHGAIRTTWSGLAAEYGSLGYPTSDQQSLGGGAALQDFQHGVITLSASGTTSVAKF